MCARGVGGVRTSLDIFVQVTRVCNSIMQLHSRRRHLVCGGGGIRYPLQLKLATHRWSNSFGPDPAWPRLDWGHLHLPLMGWHARIVDC